MAELEVGDLQTIDRVAVGRRAHADSLERPRKPEDQSALDELQRLRLLTYGHCREQTAEQPRSQHFSPIVRHGVGNERVERESEFGDARDRGDRLVGVACQDRGVGPDKKRIRFRSDGVDAVMLQGPKHIEQPAALARALIIVRFGYQQQGAECIGRASPQGVRG